MAQGPIGQGQIGQGPIAQGPHAMALSAAPHGIEPGLRALVRTSAVHSSAERVLGCRGWAERQHGSVGRLDWGSGW
jgi:hypothetical protein